jgi:2-phosphosulfolactate phosphatase
MAAERCFIHPLEPRVFDGPVVIIDVIRAFTTAAAAFDAGAREILCVEDLDEARCLRARHDDVILMGEERGERPPGFDYGNSPVQFAGVPLHNRVLVQRTSHGTRGLLWTDAPLMLAGSAVNAAATAHYLAALDTPINLVCTWDQTEEDLACAEHIKALLDGCPVPADITAQRVVDAGRAHRRLWTRPRTPQEVKAFETDVDACAAVDAHPQVMVAHKRQRVVHLTCVTDAD